MLGSLGVTLVIYVGKADPQSAPYALMKAIRRVTVTVNDELKDSFQLLCTVGEDKSRDADLFSLAQVSMQSRIIIGVYIGATFNVLIDGFITHKQYAPSHRPGESTLTMTGRGLYYKMGLQEKSLSHAGKSDSQIVTDILSSYQEFDLRPQDNHIEDTKNTPADGDRPRWQHQTDLAFLQKLADKNGYVFYIESTDYRKNYAYFGKRNVKLLQPALCTNMGSLTNVSWVDFVEDSDRPVSITGAFFDREHNQLVTIPAPQKGAAPLSGQPLQPVRLLIRRGIASWDYAQAQAELQAKTDNAPDAVGGQGEVDIVRYGAILCPRRLISLSGAGLSYDGTYYIKSVTHTLEPKKYTQRFSIVRDGTKPAS